MFSYRITKPLGDRTATAELYSDEQLVAEVIATGGGGRMLYVSGSVKGKGLDWAALVDAAARIEAALDEADEDMRQTRAWLGEK
ncbi:MAG TPA: hypothetical protein VF636_04470 [Sphingomonas sp.]|jgi:hypothetical protein